MVGSWWSNYGRQLMEILHVLGNLTFLKLWLIYHRLLWYPSTCMHVLTWKNLSFYWVDLYILGDYQLCELEGHQKTLNAWSCLAFLVIGWCCKLKEVPRRCVRFFNVEIISNKVHKGLCKEHDWMKCMHMQKHVGQTQSSQAQQTMSSKGKKLNGDYHMWTQWGG
jgi:hypothetical protein